MRKGEKAVLNVKRRKGCVKWEKEKSVKWIIEYPLFCLHAIEGTDCFLFSRFGELSGLVSLQLTGGVMKCGQLCTIVKNTGCVKIGCVYGPGNETLFCLIHLFFTNFLFSQFSFATHVFLILNYTFTININSRNVLSRSLYPLLHFGFMCSKYNQH